MLTFEEFFQKKKINLVQFQTAEPALFAEFSKHYPLMGEKSFDHTKKYWFNNLRRTYPLKEIVKPHAVQADAISQTATQGIAVAAAQNASEAIERPKFKEDNLPELVEDNVLEQDVSMLDNEILIRENKQETSGEPSSPKPAFKPRFTPKNIKKPEAEVTPEQETQKPEPATEPVAKPAFKPRFNMQNIKKEPVKEASETENLEVPKLAEPENKAEETVAKPEFKPRFNMQNMNPTQAENISEVNINTVSVELAPEVSAEIQQPEAEKEETPAKPAYKPRFQMKNVKQVEKLAEPAAESPENSIPELAIQTAESKTENVEPATENPQSTSESVENKEAKPVYKPRFQMKNMPKPPSDQT